MESPVLLIVFNRPRCTRKVFQQIRKAKPKHLFIAGDGPRPNVAMDAKGCAKVKDILSVIDWDCNCRYLYQEQNLGCASAVSGAINWFFDQIDRGIILEDDTVPAVSFFHFADELLNKYKDHRNIMHIAGTNIIPSPQQKTSYRFSHLIHIGGWATWKRAWSHFDIEMKEWNTVRTRLRERMPFGNMTENYIDSLNRCHASDLHVWGPKWSYSCLAQNGLSIVPKTNLIYNVGYGPGAVHTRSIHNPFAHIKPMELDFPLVHPSDEDTNPAFDQNYLHYLFSERQKKPNVLMKYRYKIETKAKQFANRYLGLLN